MIRAVKLFLVFFVQPLVNPFGGMPLLTPGLFIFFKPDVYIRLKGLQLGKWPFNTTSFDLHISVVLSYVFSYGLSGYLKLPGYLAYGFVFHEKRPF